MTAIPTAESIGRAVMLFHQGVWQRATINHAVDDDSRHAALTLVGADGEPTYVEDVQHASQAGGCDTLWMWPEDHELLTKVLSS